MGHVRMSRVGVSTVTGSSRGFIFGVYRLLMSWSSTALASPLEPKDVACPGLRVHPDMQIIQVSSRES